MSAVMDDDTTKLHVTPDGHVWYSRGEYTPQDSGMSVDEFLNQSSLLLSVKRTFRLIGNSTNAELISALYTRFNKGSVRAVQIAGPNVLPGAVNSLSPETVFIYMRNCYTTPSCGGWHTLSLYDYPTYALSARLQRNGFSCDDQAETYLRLHPAFCALSFIPTLNIARVAQLLVSIIDPRWYADRHTSELGKKIKLFCGLTPKIQKKVDAADAVLARRREFMCALVSDCWNTKNIADVDLGDPANFLYRVKAQHADESKGNLRASQKFVEYLNLNWIQALTPALKGSLFIPSMFFLSSDETDAYLKHLDKFRS